MHRSPTGNLVPLDLEIEATLRKNRAERRRKLLQDRIVGSILEEETHFSDSSSSDSPSSKESATYLPKVVSMADEHKQRVTFEDYSSSSVPQFITSIARLEGQAHNINYPYSLIHLIQGNLFQGLPNEDPYAHLATFIEICSIVKIAGMQMKPLDSVYFHFPWQVKPRSGSTHLCGSNDFQDYFDGAKESRVKQILKIQESSFKNKQDQDSRIKRRLNQDKY